MGKWGWISSVAVFVAGLLCGGVVAGSSAGGALWAGSTSSSIVTDLAGEGGTGVEAAGLAGKRYALFQDERKQVERNLGVSLGEVYVLLPQPDMRGYYTHVGGAEIIALTGPWFREDQIRQTAAHELGHLAHTLAGITFRSNADREEWAETFRACFGSDEARAPRWGPAVAVPTATCDQMRETVQQAVRR
jgi:hypothetical protein